ncbi:MAG: dihydrodipicolinate reductase [Myxococcota bacterium]
MTYRVIQWATGGVGRSSISAIATHPELELVGCWVHGADKEGRDAGELAGIGKLGVAATRDVDALLAIDADCVVYSPVIANPEEIRRILESGKNVVTPLGWFYPKSLDTTKLEAACRKGNATLHGTGIHPGGITERFPLVVSALSTRITHVRAEEFSDIRSYAAPQVVGDVMLFGKTPDEAVKSPMVKLLGAGFLQSVDMVADAIGVELDPERRIVHQIAVATKPIENTPIGTIAEGRVAGQRFQWQGTKDGEPVVSAIVNWMMGDQHLAPAGAAHEVPHGWRFGSEGERFEVEVTGEPPVHLTFHGLHPTTLDQDPNPGVQATALHCVNAVPFVCRAEPGIKTYLDLPPYWGTAHPRLRSR